MSWSSSPDGDPVLNRIRDELEAQGWWAWHDRSGLGADGPHVQVIPGTPQAVVDGIRQAAFPATVLLSEGRSNYGWYAYDTDQVEVIDDRGFPVDG